LSKAVDFRCEMPLKQAGVASGKAWRLGFANALEGLSVTSRHVSSEN
jgi:hypothetical protein